MGNQLPVARILLLNDDLSFGNAMTELLERHGYQVHQATSRDEAIELAQRQPFELALVDAGPEGVNLEALEPLKSLHPCLSSIVMTGSMDEELPVRAAQLGADDFLLQPFGLKVLLQAVQALIEQGTPFRTVFERVDQLVTRPSFDARLQKLNELRLNCLKHIFLLLRHPHYDAEAAYHLYCLWERLEIDYIGASSSVDWSKLGLAYLEFQEQLQQSNLPECNSSQTSPEVFARLRQRILKGQIERVHLLRAVQLSQKPEARRESLEAYVLHQWLWDQAESNESSWVGLTVGEYHLRNQRWPHLYEASSPARPDFGDLILCLPHTPETEELVHKELEWQRARLLETREGRHLLLYPGEYHSLGNKLPPEGVTPERAWQLLRPVFYQVLKNHQEGKFSGYFCLRDIEWAPDQPCRLTRLRDHEYSLQHQTLGKAGHLNLALCSAPEVAQKAVPDAASDQAVLGRILFEVILGGHYPDAETQIQLRYLGSESATDHFRPFIPRLHPLARPFYCLSHSDPQQRYPSLQHAIQAIEVFYPPQSPVTAPSR